MELWVHNPNIKLKLYNSESTQYIEPGNYTIIVGGMYKPTSTMGKLIYKIQV